MPDSLSPTRSQSDVWDLSHHVVSRPSEQKLFTRIHTLDEDALLNIFYILGLDFVDPYEDVISQADWDRVRWWYKPAQVCRRWRNLIFASPVRLNLQLVCTYGTPVADMLAHSPPLPLVINYLESDRERTDEDDNGIILALQHCDRVRRIGLVAPPTNLLRPLTAMAGRFSTLERVFIRSRTEEDANLKLPESLQAPSLRGLALCSVGLSPGSPLLATSTGLVILVLERIPPLAYFPPSELLARLSSSTQLRTLSIGFTFPAPGNYAEGQLSHTQTMAHITLPNLRSLFFHGTHDYLETLLSRMSTPQLEAFHVWFYYRFTYNCLHLSQFTTTIPKLRFNVAYLHFFQSDVMLIASNANKGNRVPFRVQINCTHLDWQVASAAQVFNAFLPILSLVEHLALLYYEDDRGDPRELYHDNDVIPAQWRELLRPFRNVKTLSVADALVWDLSRSLRVGDREPSLGLLLPELRELRYSGGDRAGDAFAPFILARQTAGKAIDLVLDSTPRRSISPLP